ncbi:RND family efflux system, inner membrane transporter, AcrB family [Poseidonibacter lekithochrous]|nr:RND family efflux system, inner membrane transporter, AcrB family [Poseidonibacter lekithochrous]
MEKLIKFFLTKTRLNYTAFIFLILLGIVSYQTIPKDVFPSIKIDKIAVSGSYSGASIDNLNKMAVTKLEKDMKSLNGVKKVESFIKNAEFSVILTLEKGLDTYSLLNKVKDIISNNKGNLPSDMDEPRASIVDFSFPLISVTIASNNKTQDELISLADKLKISLSSIENISKVDLYESTTRVYEIILDNQKIDLYGLNKNTLQNQIQNISYIFPLGKIEDKKGHLYLSAKNGAKSADELLNTMIKIDDKSIYLSDIAKVKRKYQQTDVLSFLNGSKNIELGLSKNEKANAIELVKQVKEKVKKFNTQYKDVEVGTFYDTSILIKKRLNTVISGIMFGLLLVAIAIYILINKRVAFIVVLGIPTAILMGVVFLSFTSYTINMITLIGALLVLGILVDDAIIIAENIQRHIAKGEDKLQSAINGTKEVITPVLASSLTTVFAFIPMMMLTGELGEFLKMIPVAVVVLILASLVESFIFLPIHGLHTLNKDDKELDWSKANNIYRKCLEGILKYKKTFVIGFTISITALTIFLISSMRYQMFPDFDGDRFFIRGKFDMNHSVLEVKNKTLEIQAKLLEIKEDLGLKSIAYTVGLRTDNQENIEIKPSVFQFNIEVKERVPQNFVDEFITPIFSFNTDEENRTRKKSLDEIVLYLNDLFKDYKPEGLSEFAIKKEGAGITSNDIEILISTKDTKLLNASINELKQELKNIDGIIFVDDTAKKGIKELKIEINEYGQSLGFNETNVSNILSSSYLKSTQSKGLDDEGVIEFISYDINKNSFEEFENFEVQVPNTSKQIALNEIANFIYIENFDSIYKQNGINIKSVVANVNNKIITATETIELLANKLQELEEKGVSIILEGEAEQNKQMAKELTFAFFIAIFLIFLTLLTMFDSFKYTVLVLSLIPLSVTGAIFGHLILGMNLTLTSIVGILGLAGVVINDAIVMLDFIKKTESVDELIKRATLRLRPIVITSITTFLGLSTLIFFATGQSKILQPLATSLGFGLLWGTVLTLLFLPALFAMLNKKIKG